VSLFTNVYLDRGSNPPRRCRVITVWRTPPGGQHGAPCNVAVRYLDDGTMAVIPFPRRLIRERQGPARPPQTTAPHQAAG
jgi:hypothetical protein